MQQRSPDGVHLLRELERPTARCKPHGGRDLIVARAPRVQPLAGITDPPRKLYLDRHVNVLVGDVERERATLDILEYPDESFLDRRGVGLWDDAPAAQHARVRDRPRDVLGIQALIHRKRCPERLLELVRGMLETAAPLGRGITHRHHRASSSRRAHRRICPGTPGTDGSMTTPLMTARSIP